MRGAVVLGAGGFLGSHLCRGLLREGWAVTAVVRDPRAAYVERRLGDVLGELTVVAGDAASPTLLDHVLATADVVYPFAGQSGAIGSLDDPLGDLQANVGPQLAVLEAVRRAGARTRVVFPSSRLVYGRARQLPVGEEHPQRPTSAYGVAKLAAERYHLLYADAHGVPATALRISNPYGPRQDRPDRAFGVVGSFLATAEADGAIELFGGGTQLRDYVFVEDLVALLLTAATHPDAPGHVFNAGGPEATRLRDMAQAVLDVVGRGRLTEVPWTPGAAAVETGDYVSDLRAVSSRLGWTPQTALHDGLEQTWKATHDVRRAPA